MHQQKLDNVLNLSSEDRYGYFIRKVADLERIYLIKDENGYAIFGDPQEKTIISAFPEREFANMFLTDTWSSCFVEEMNLENFLVWLDKLAIDDIKMAGFPNKDFNAIVVDPNEMKSHLLYELDQYE